MKKILSFAFALRLALLPWTFHSDVTATYWWGRFAHDYGLRGFYDWLNFGGYGRPDQPMINIYYDLFVRQIYNLIYQPLWFLNTHLAIFPSNFITWYSNYGNQILLKLPMVLADIALIYLCYLYAKKYLSSSKAHKISLILALYPPYIFNSAIWGSGDSIVNLFALLSVFLFWQKKYILPTILFIISVLYKPSLLIWSPILLIVILKNSPKPKDIIVTIITFLVSVLIISYPFTPQNLNPLLWFIKTMTSRILPGFMPHLTANALNLWSLLFGVKLIFDSYQILGLISARVLSLTICGILYLLLLIRLYKNYSQKSLLLALASLSLVTFSFMTRMHERYSLPALIPLLILCYYDRRYFKYFTLLSLTHIFNVICAWWYPQVLLFTPTTIAISLINVLIALKLTLTSWNSND